MRGGAKQAAFGTDVSPKVLIVAGLTCGYPIFSSLFIDDGNGPVMKVDAIREIVKDYADRIVTPVYIGIRKGYLKNENEVSALAGVIVVTFVVTTPIDASEQIAKSLNQFI